MIIGTILIKGEVPSIRFYHEKSNSYLGSVDGLSESPCLCKIEDPATRNGILSTTSTGLKIQDFEVNIEAICQCPAFLVTQLGPRF